MLRPNYAYDAPPTHIRVGGFDYPCNTDFKVWLEVLRLLKDVTPETDDAQLQMRNAQVLEEMQDIIFGGVLADEDMGEVFAAICAFAGGYPSVPMGDEGGDNIRRFSFEWDLNYIIIAIRNQSGIDLSYRRKEPFHWWEFLLEFNTLCGDHYILNLMEARGYKGNDKELLKRKRICALPVEYTAEEQAAIDAFNAEFEEE